MMDQEAVQLVLDFAREMNELQTAFYPKLRQDGANTAQVFGQYHAQSDAVDDR